MRLTAKLCAYALPALTIGVCAAQTAGHPADHAISFRPNAQITARAQGLLQQAKTAPTGVAFATIDDFPGYHMMIVARDKTGPAETHANWADVMIVLDGEATEVTGGTMLEGKLDPATGETRGPRVEGGTRTKIAKGDVLNIPSGMPHWTVLATGKTLTAYVVKVAATNGTASK